MPDVLVVGDTGPIITGYIYSAGDKTRRADLSGDTSVKFQMRRLADRRLMVDADADIVTAISGEVSYTLGATDTAVPGDYGIEWQVTYPDGKKQTTATLHEVTIRRR
jgi:Rib/alpha/Esp surface antigen-like repeat protein